MNKTTERKPSQILRETKIKPVIGVSNWIEGEMGKNGIVGLRACAHTVLVLETQNYSFNSNAGLWPADENGKPFDIDEIVMKEYGIPSRDLAWGISKAFMDGQRADGSGFESAAKYLESIGF